jgi:hypothetical protein
MTKFGRIARLLTSAVMAIASITSCGHSTSTTASTTEKPREPWPTVMSEVNFTWTSDPGIDVLTEPAVAIRAYTESRLLVSFGGSMDYLYPGFDHAVASDQPVGSSPSSQVALWPTPGKGNTRLVGTEQSHILRIEQSGNTATAIVCRWAWGAALQQPNGLYRINSLNNGAATGVLMNRISLAAPAEGNSTTVTPQQGPSRYATTDAFAGWRVVGNLDELIVGASDPEWPDYDHDLAACVERAPEPLERRQYLTSADRPRSDFPTLPASPGWPVESQ